MPANPLPPQTQLLQYLVDVQKTQRLLPQAGLTPPPAVIVVGISGGADSVALLHALVQLAPNWQLQLHAAHVDHQLRADSAADAAFVEQLCAKLCIPYHSLQLIGSHLANHPLGLEEAARRARYAFLSQVADQVTGIHQTPVVVVAHHKDDQAETLVMNFLRGSGLVGLAGMPWRLELASASPYNPTSRAVHVVRPLLGLRRETLREHLSNSALGWRTDPSNSDTTRLRNLVRHQLLPQLAQVNPNIHETLARTAELLAAESARAGRLNRDASARLLHSAAPAPIAGALQRSLPPGPLLAERIVLRLNDLLAQDIATQRGVIHHLLAFFDLDRRDAGFERIDALLQQLPHARWGQIHPLVGSLAWSIHSAMATRPPLLSLHLASTFPLPVDHPLLPVPLEFPLPLTCPGSLTFGEWQLHVRLLPLDALPKAWHTVSRWEAYLDAPDSAGLALTTWRPGMHFAPLGLQGRHKQIGNLFTDQKVPQPLRLQWPVLIDRHRNTVLWVCGLAVAHPARITAATQLVCHLQWQPRPK
jgi:tRNA(Ile)-lysidine synthase